MAKEITENELLNRLWKAQPPNVKPPKIAEPNYGSSEAIRRRYGYFTWPRDMESGDLPWEATGAGLELIKLVYPARPTIDQVFFFWRATQAVPDAPVEIRSNIANTLWIYAEDRHRFPMELVLAYRPWESEEAQAAYLLAMQDAIETKPKKKRKAA